MKDPVCNMDVSPDDAAASFEYEGETYYFCSEKCRDKFQSDPKAVLEKKEEKKAERKEEKQSPGGDEREYTCPMHPEVVQKGPGSCPECGIVESGLHGLESETATCSGGLKRPRTFVSVFKMTNQQSTGADGSDAIADFFQHLPLRGRIVVVCQLQARQTARKYQRMWPKTQL